MQQLLEVSFDSIGFVQEGEEGKGVGGGWVWVPGKGKLGLARGPEREHTQGLRGGHQCRSPDNPT